MFDRVPGPESGSDRHRGRTGFLIILAAGALLRLFGLEIQSLWWDEAWQFHVATAPGVGALFERLLDPAVAAHPPLSHVVSHLFLRLAATDFMLRLPAALFGIGSLILIHRLAAGIFSARVATWAMLVMALSPFHLHYSQEGRMYSQLVFLALGSTWLLLRALERPSTGRWVLYAAAITASIYTHVYASLGILAHVIWMLRYHRERLRPFAFTVVGAMVLFAPMVAFFMQRVSQARVPYGGAGSSLASLPYALFVYAGGFSLGPSVHELRENRAIAFDGFNLVLVLIVLAVFGFLVFLGLRSAWFREHRERGALVILGFLVPVLGVFLASFLPRMTFNVRYTAWGFPFFALLVGLGLAGLRHRRAWVGAMGATLVIGISLFSIVNHFADPRYAKEDVRSAVAHWRERAAGEAILSYNGFPTIDRYLIPGERGLHHSIWRRSNTAVRAHAVMEETGNRDGITVVLCRDWHRIVETFLREDFDVLEETDFRGHVRMLRIAVRDVDRES